MSAKKGDAIVAMRPEPELRLTDIAFEQLEEMIVMRQLPPNTMVSEQQLATQLNMGRTPIREALQRLRQIGFVEMQPRRGTMVCGTDIHQQFELLEVRKPLEELMVGCACVRATAEELDVMAHLSRGILQAAAKGDTIQYLKYNRQIHENEVKAAHNSMLTQIMMTSHAQSRRFWYQNIQQNQAFAEGAKCHSDVLNTIIARDERAARLAVRRLMKYLEKLTYATLSKFAAKPARY
ncbi:GntR family transcriptional regulator [Acerihabitans sp.]|uniref:GntR family transcriptional regulator n=1 Tax=Acerihabitans sp. TaxID=2811394 RepID=UPI002ED95CF8